MNPRIISEKPPATPRSLRAPSRDRRWHDSGSDRRVLAVLKTQARAAPLLAFPVEAVDGDHRARARSRGNPANTKARRRESDDIVLPPQVVGAAIMQCEAGVEMLGVDRGIAHEADARKYRSSLRV